MFRVLVEAAESTGADVAMCDYAKVADGHPKRARVSNIRGGSYTRQEIVDEILPTIIMDDRLEGPDVLSVCRCIYRREFLAANSIVFNARAKYSEDYLFSLAVILRAQAFVYAKGRHEYLYRYNPQSISRTIKSDSWQTYVYLNEAMEREVLSVDGVPLEVGLERQLRLHMVYFALNTANRIKASNTSFRKKRAMLRDIVDSERLQSALTQVRLPHAPALTRTTIACIRWRSPVAMVALDTIARRLRKLR